MKLLQEINPKIFREYDIRGIYGEDITIDVAYTIGKSFGSYVKDMTNKVIVGYDNRVSSPDLAEALIKGILSSGMDVINLGLVTSPMFYFSKFHFNINAGIMITASHNPKEYNGFKISFNKEYNAYGLLIQQFKEFTNAGNFLEGNGNLTNVDIRSDYLKAIKDSIKLGDRKIKVVIDCGNGTGSVVVKDIMSMFDVECEYLYCESDPDFPNHHPDPAEHKNMRDLQNKVLELGFDLGIGIDGDADRVGIVDEKGNIISADLYMLIIYRDIVNKMKNKKALFDVKCSRTLIDELEKLGIEKNMSRTGNSYISMQMHEGGYDFGGEYSGHVYFKDKYLGIDDGIYAGLRLIEILSYTNKPLSTHLEGINKYYSTEELKVKVTDENKFDIVESVKKYSKDKGYNVIELDGARVEFNDGWALVRASNTGPNITARFEAKNEERLEEIKNEFIKVIDSYIN